MRRQYGQQLPEYAIIISLVALVSIPALISLGKHAEQPIDQLASGKELDTLVSLVNKQGPAGTAASNNGSSTPSNPTLQVGQTGAGPATGAPDNDLAIGDGPGANTTSVDGQKAQATEIASAGAAGVNGNSFFGSLGGNGSGAAKGKGAGSPTAEGPVKDLRLVAHLADRIAKTEAGIDQLNINEASKAELRKYVNSLQQLQDQYTRLGGISQNYNTVVPIASRIEFIQNIAYYAYLSDTAVNAKTTRYQTLNGVLPLDLLQIVKATPKPSVRMTLNNVTSPSQSTHTIATELAKLAN